MKTIVSLRVLGVLGFLLLMAPFYDQCNGRGIKEKAVEPAEVTEKAVIPAQPTVANKTTDTLAVLAAGVESEPFYVKAYNSIDNPDNQNGFELADLARIYLDMNFAEFKTEANRELAKNKPGGIFTVLQLPVRSFTFVFIVLISFLLMIMVFTTKYTWIYKMAIVNLVLLLITIICILFFDELFETFRQIKWGYYAFITVQTALLIQSKRILEPSAA